MHQRFFIIAAILGLLAVAAGTFGAHGLEGRIEERLLDSFEVGVRYQMYHALALLAISIIAARSPGKAIHTAGWLMTVGVILFSGSLYAYAYTGIRSLAMITPIGGVCFMGGWVALIVAACRVPSPLSGSDAGHHS